MLAILLFQAFTFTKFKCHVIYTLGKGKVCLSTLQVRKITTLKPGITWDYVGLPLAPSLAVHIHAFGLNPVNSALKLRHIHYFSPSPLSPLQSNPNHPHLDHYSMC